MKTSFNSIFILLSLLVGVLQPRPAAAEQLWSTRSLLSQHFKSSEHVTYLRVRPSDAQRARLAARLRRELPKREYTFFVATTKGHIDGFALFDDERGQHEPISFATFFDVEGRITRVEVVAYREAYGDGIRAARFREQFVGRSARSRFRAGEDVDAVSGATISSRSMCLGVERAAALFDETVRMQGSAILAAR